MAFTYLTCMREGCHATVPAYVEVREQLSGVRSLLPRVGPRDQTQVVRVSGNLAPILNTEVLSSVV